MNVTSKIVQLTVINKLDTDVVLTWYALGMLGPFEVEHSIHEEIFHESNCETVEGKQQMVFDVKLTKLPNPGIYSLPVAFKFTRRDLDKESVFYIIKYIQAAVDDDIVKETREQSIPYQKSKRVRIPNKPDVAVERGEPPSM